MGEKIKEMTWEVFRGKYLRTNGKTSPHHLLLDENDSVMNSDENMLRVHVVHQTTGCEDP